MPRSIQQLKHREIPLPGLPAARLFEATHLLERIPGVAAMADDVRCCVCVDYWVDEHTLSDLEAALTCSGFALDNSPHARIVRCQISQDEEVEREQLDLAPCPSCKSCGVFAYRLTPRKDDLDILPLYYQ